MDESKYNVGLPPAPVKTEKFEVIASNIDQFISEQDNPEWRLSTVEEWENTCKKEKTWDSRENFDDRILIPLSRYRKLDIETNCHLIDKYGLSLNEMVLTNPSVYALTKDTAVLEKLKANTDSMFGQMQEWPQKWWLSRGVIGSFGEWKTGWVDKPNNFEKMEELLDSQALIVDMTMRPDRWANIKLRIEWLRSQNISFVLTEKSCSIMYAYHFVKPAK